VTPVDNTAAVRGITEVLVWYLERLTPDQVAGVFADLARLKFEVDQAVRRQ
jgi:hypothetical protein